MSDEETRAARIMAETRFSGRGVTSCELRRNPPSLLVQASTAHSSISGHWSIVSFTASHLWRISEFAAWKHQPFTHIEFTRNVNSMLAIIEAGKVVRVFQTGDICRSCRCGTLAHVRSPEGPHTWRCNAINSSDDGRWMAVGTRKRTVCMFAINSCGGKPDD